MPVNLKRLHDPQGASDVLVSCVAAMDFSDFKATLSADAPPAALSELLRALWLDRKGDFAGAHGIAQEVSSAEGARVHAHLHRKEGDASNARYWYRRAGCDMPAVSLDAEWQALVEDLL